MIKKIYPLIILFTSLSDYSMPPLTRTQKARVKPCRIRRQLIRMQNRELKKFCESLLVPARFNCVLPYLRTYTNQPEIIIRQLRQCNAISSLQDGTLIAWSPSGIICFWDIKHPKTPRAVKQFVSSVKDPSNYSLVPLDNLDKKQFKQEKLDTVFELSTKELALQNNNFGLIILNPDDTKELAPAITHIGICQALNNNKLASNFAYTETITIRDLKNLTDPLVELSSKDHSQIYPYYFREMRDGTIKALLLPRGRLATWPTDTSCNDPSIHVHETARITSFTDLEDGTLVLGLSSGNVELRDPKTFSLLKAFPAHNGFVAQLLILSNKKLVTLRWNRLFNKADAKVWSLENVSSPLFHINDLSNISGDIVPLLYGAFAIPLRSKNKDDADQIAIWNTEQPNALQRNKKAFA